MDKELLRLGLWAVVAGIIGVVVVAVVANYVLAKNATGCYLPQDNYIAIKHEVSTLAEAIDNHSVNPYLYILNSNLKQDNIDASYFPVINDTLKVILIDSESYGDDRRHGIDADTIGFYALPETLGSLTISRVDRAGSASITYDDNRIEISPGETWTDVVTRLIPVRDNDRTILINVTVIDRITNMGMAQKWDASDERSSMAADVPILPVFY